jgi:hypothetical protein
MSARSERHHARAWPSWFGGLILLIVVNGPVLFVSDLPVRYRLSWRAGGIHLDFAVLLAAGLGPALLALIAPLVAYRRRDALLIFVPIVGWALCWVFGARLVELANSDAIQNAGEPANAWQSRLRTEPRSERHRFTRWLTGDPGAGQ